MKKILFCFFIFLFTLPVFAKNTILIVGDSLSASYGISQNKGWTALLQKKLQDNHYDYRVVNSSISGNTTSNGLKRLPPLLKKYQPKITIIELGGNDGLRGLQIDAIKNNLQKMIELAKKAGSEILLIGVRLPPNYGIAYTQQFHNIFVDLANKNQVKLVPFFLNKIDDDTKLMSDDRVHPREAAQPLMLENVWVELVKMLR